MTSRCYITWQCSLLSHAYTPVTGSQGALVRNELVHVNILTGKVWLHIFNLGL